MSLTESEIETVNVISVVVSAFSVLGSLFIIASYLYYVHLRKFAFKLVFILSINDLLNQIGDFILPSPGDIIEMEATDDISFMCNFQAWMESFFELSSVLWTTAIAATLYMSVFLRMKSSDIESKMPWFAAVCYGVPAILTVVPGAMGAYGVAGAWCWIKDDYGYMRFVQFFIPLWIAIIFNAVVYVRVIRVISMTFRATGGDDGTAAQMRQIINKLRFYPLILIIVWLFATINRTVEASNGNDPVFWLFCLQKFFSSLQGFLNAFAYGFSGGVREAIRGTLANKCPCLVKETSIADRLIGDTGTPVSPSALHPVQTVSGGRGTGVAKQGSIQVEMGSRNASADNFKPRSSSSEREDRVRALSHERGTDGHLHATPPLSHGVQPGQEDTPASGSSLDDVAVDISLTPASTREGLDEEEK